MLAVFVLYMAATVFIAWWYSRGERTHKEFVLGGGRFSGTALALSERATGESAWLLLGLTGHAYADGLSTIWVALGCVLGILFIWMVMAGRLREETEKTGAMTVSSLLARRFPGAEKPIALLSAVIVIFFFLLYIAAQFSGSGKVLQGTFGLDPFWGILIASVVVTVYCGLGGFIAVVVTDVFQALLMIFTLVAFPVIALVLAARHDVSIASALQAAGPNYLSLTRGMTGTPAVILILSGLSWALGYTGQPQLLTRMMAIRSEDEVRRAVSVATVWTLLAYSGAILIGMLGVAFVKSGLLGAGASAVSADAEKILPAMVVALVSPILAGVLLSGVISAMMSTASSEVTVSSASFTEDIFREPRGRRPRVSPKGDALPEPGRHGRGGRGGHRPGPDDAGHRLQPRVVRVVGHRLVVRAGPHPPPLLEEALPRGGLRLADHRNGRHGRLEDLPRAADRGLGEARQLRHLVRDGGPLLARIPGEGAGLPGASRRP